jgi:hypothetical protein
MIRSNPTSNVFEYQPTLSLGIVLVHCKIEDDEFTILGVQDKEHRWMSGRMKDLCST